MTSIDFEVWCACGEALGVMNITYEKGQALGMTTYPCEKCKKKKEEEGYAEGYAQANKDSSQA